jgi:hypothetical protein
VGFDPNKGDIDRFNDYTANVYFGEVDIAEADPVIAAAGGVVSGTHAAALYRMPLLPVAVALVAAVVTAAAAAVLGL